MRIEAVAYDNHTTRRIRFKHLSEAERGIIEKLLELEYGICGYTQKTVKTKFGEMEIDKARDREGEFGPKIISKYKRIFKRFQESIKSNK